VHASVPHEAYTANNSSEDEASANGDKDAEYSGDEYAFDPTPGAEEVPTAKGDLSESQSISVSSNTIEPAQVNFQNMKKPKVFKNRAIPPKNTPAPIVDLEKEAEKELVNKIKFVDKMRTYEKEISQKQEMEAVVQGKLKSHLQETLGKPSQERGAGFQTMAGAFLRKTPSKTRATVQVRGSSLSRKTVENPEFKDLPKLTEEEQQILSSTSSYLMLKTSYKEAIKSYIVKTVLADRTKFHF